MLLSYLRTILLYLILIAVIRLMGKRQIGQMEPSEFVVTMLTANLASIPMQDSGIPLLSGLVPILTVLGAELVLSHLSLRSLRFRRLLCGKPVILIENGRVVQNNLHRTGITLDELTGHLRQKDVLDLQTVQYAILETNGNLSVFPYASQIPASAMDAGISTRQRYLPLTLIDEGHLISENLALAGKTDTWLRQVLKEKKTTVSATWLLTVDKKGHIVWIPREGKT